MATRAFELTRLDSATFEHLVNTLALKILGRGVTGFAPGPDGGRDGYFEGEAEYPSAMTRWRGIWYIQSKFHAPALTGDPQKWLQQQVQHELDEFARADSGRILPDNWIIATNVEPSAVAGKGTFDRVLAAVRKFNPELAARTHIWGGKKILDFLAAQPDVARHYGGLLTSGDVIAAIVQSLSDASASINEIIHHLVVTQLGEQQFTKLEQAGSSADTRPGIQSLYTDLPFVFEKSRHPQILAELTRALARNHRPTVLEPTGTEWDKWRRRPHRSRIWFVRGGPGNGKSTLTQFVCQIHRAAIIADTCLPISAKVAELAADISARAKASGYWPLAARVPIHFELRNYAHWYGEQTPGKPRGVLSYLATRLSHDLEQSVLVGTLKRAFASGRWLFVFDGLDEVPGDVKDALAKEINLFIDGTLLECQADAMVVCTSRPQGYSGQFDDLRPSVIDLAKLRPTEALACADPVLAIDRSSDEVERYRATLRDAIASPSIREIMTTPLQSHIMAVVVRDGGRPPERKWLLFSNFYEVIKKREANRNLADPRIARLLREGDKLIKALHNRLGFELHYRAEKSTGAQTSISRERLRTIISEVVNNLQDDDIENTIALLDEATTERLVLVNTPENGETVRFDIRPLQEFFAAEYIYESANEIGFNDRLRTIATDSHWREVMHFLLSALVEQERRGELAQAVEVLSDADDSPSDQRRAIARRLSIGGILAARLLREGVLESDKRTRSLFRKCFNPLLATTDAKALLGSAPPQHSSAWLIGVLLDAIAETAPAENIGAACLFPLLIDDGALLAERAAVSLAECDEAYLAAFVDRLTPHRRANSSDDIPTWVRAALLRRILSNDWRKLSGQTLGQIYYLLGADKDRFVSAAVSLGISSDTAKILLGFFLHYPHNRESDVIEVRRIGGMVEERVLEPVAELRQFDWPEETWSEMEELGGLALTCTLLAKAALHDDTEALLRLEASLDGSDDLWRIPTDYRDLFCQVGECRASGVTVAEQFRNSNRGRFYDHTLVTGTKAPTDWHEIMSTFPSIGTMFVNDGSNRKQNDEFLAWLNEPENMTFFAEILTKRQRIGLIGLGELGGYARRFPLLATVLKDAVAQTSPAMSRHGSTRYNSQFRLDLPADAMLLPHVASYVSPDRGDLSYLPPDERITFGEAAEIVKRFIPDSTLLRAIWDDNNAAANIRAAAGALLLPFADEDHPLEADLYNRLLELYDTSISEWFVPVILQFVTPAVRSGKHEILDFVEALLSLARADLPARCASETVIADWREITRAPVHASLAEGIWNA